MTTGGYDDLFRPDDSSRAVTPQTPALPPELSPRAPQPTRTSGPNFRRIGGWVAGITSLIVLGVSGIGYTALNNYNGKITREDVFAGIDNRPAAPQSGAPINILLVGSDSREGLTKAERNKFTTGIDQGKRSDTMILMHISGDNSNVTMVSLPRDSYVNIPSYKDNNGNRRSASKNKLNASFSKGGAPLTIRTIESNTGLKIDHYVEINIAGFVKMVDSLGGAQVCLAKSVNDRDSGLKLSKGKHTLDGTDALAYVRARSIYVDQDLGRIRAQQAFIGSLARKALSAQTLTNPLKLNRFLDAALSSVTTDKQLDRTAILNLASRMREVKANQINFLTVPIKNSDYRVPGVGSSVLWSETKATALFDKLRQDQPIAPKVSTVKATVPAGKITIQVFNGAGVTGLGAKAANDLARVGFGMAGPAKNADVTGQEGTVIKYDPTNAKQLKTLQAAMPDATVEAVPNLGKTFQVVAGSQWSGASRVTIATAKPKSSVPTTSAADTTCT
jgi:LCP family protein required for cell wall assembly